MGSEMCIRDRHPVDRRHVDLADGVAAGMADLQARQVTQLDRLAGCLLYTSDAADDLLCVDLGGRRIIKKKTNNKSRDSIYKPTSLSDQPTSNSNTSP